MVLMVQVECKMLAIKMPSRLGHDSVLFEQAGSPQLRPLNISISKLVEIFEIY